MAFVTTKTPALEPWMHVVCATDKALFIPAAATRLSPMHAIAMATCPTLWVSAMETVNPTRTAMESAMTLKANCAAQEPFGTPILVNAKFRTHARETLMEMAV